MRSSVLKLLFFLASVSAAAQPATDIFVFDLDVTKDKITIRNPKNITAKQGYDNQPFFHPEMPLLYFVSANTEARTDIFEYNLKSGQTKKITDTHDKEYSPTVTPDKQFLSCILQTDSGAQDLVKYPINGGTPTPLIQNKVVGYHTWANAKQVVVFTLPQPFKLEVVNLESGQSLTVAEGIGRSIHKIPGKEAISFVKKISDTEVEIQMLNMTSMTTSTVTKSPDGKEHDMVWTSDGKIFMSVDKGLFFIDPGKSFEWKPIIIESGISIATITRMAVSPDGKKIAIVMSEQ
jgi:tricorn protease-like protein